MSNKLTQMNNVIKHVINDFSGGVRDDTLLLVFGDHGMNDFGDHGGDSSLEVDAAFWAYSSHKKFNVPTVKREKDSNGDLDVPQIDFVPTVARLLGLPIPFGNLGGLILDLLPFGHSLDALSSMHVNAWQVHKYLIAYNQLDPSFIPSEHIMNEIHHHFEIANNLFNKVINDVSNQEAIDESMKHYYLFIRDTSRICRDRWAKFDVVRMGAGIVLVAAIVLTMIADCFKSQSTSTKYQLFLSFMIMYAVVKLRISVFGSNYYTLDLVQEYGDVTMFFVSMTSILVYNIIDSGKIQFKQSFDYIDLFNGICLVLYLFSLFSNSFIVYEDRVVFFFITTNGFLLIYRSWNNQNYRNVVLGIILVVCVRLSTYTVRYRSHGTHQMGSDTPISWEVFNSPYAAYIFVTLIPLAVLYISQKSFKTISISYAIQILFVWLYWIRRDLDAANQVKSTDSLDLQVYYPRVVYLIWLSTTLYLLISKQRSAKSRSMKLFFCTIPVLLMIKGYNYSASFALMYTQTVIIQYISRKEGGNGLWFWCWFGMQYFFSMGNQNTVNTIQWNSGFVGIQETHLVFSGILVTCNTLAPKILYIISIPWINKNNSRLYLIFHSIISLVNMINVTIQRRHLMVWAIFAPKFIFDQICLILMCAYLTAQSFTMTNKFNKKIYS
ncbi:GPI ethanolamine phosphate transferase 3 [Acrasis kona]|uniref:GPI ethanolamine phosphate transferase 3 n=1 Tax=Acrasis kona TaxID=1008807 RepID=A0AAW2ZA07_9EUKA